MSKNIDGTPPATIIHSRKIGSVLGCFVALACLTLTGCGFVTAPVGLASAELASSSVKAADVSLESSKKAAIFVQEKSIQGYEISAEMLQELSGYGRQIINWGVDWDSIWRKAPDSLPTATLVQQASPPE